jgi:hypothetical protein
VIHRQDKAKLAALQIRDVYPGSLILILTPPGSRISDPGSKNDSKRGVKKISCHTFFCSHKFHIIENYLIFEMLKKKIGHCSRNYRTFYSKIWVWDTGSVIRDPEKSYSVSLIQGLKKHRIPDPDLFGFTWTKEFFLPPILNCSF